MIYNLTIELGVSNDSFQIFECSKKSEKIAKVRIISKVRNCIRSMFIIKFKSIEVIF